MDLRRIQGYLFLLGVTALLPAIGFSQSSDNRIVDTSKSLEQVVITGQYRPQSLKQSVYKVRTIGPERIRLRAATDIITVLSTEAGIRFSTDPALAETDINILGSNGLNVKILLDGIPLVDRYGPRQSLSQIDINTVERIEIVEGPMSVSYGSDALAGVINIITKKPKAGQEHLQVNARVQEESTGGNYGPFVNDGLHNESLGITWQKGSWNAGGSFSRNIFGGWKGNGGPRFFEAKPKDQYLASGSIGFRTNKSTTNYRIDYTYEDIYAAGLLNPNNFRASDQHFFTNRYTHQVQNELRLSEKFRVSTSASYQDYQRRTKTTKLDFVSGSRELSTDPGSQDVNTFQSYFLRSTAQWFLSDKLSLQPGVEIKTDETSGQRIVAGSPSITDYSVFASAEIKPAGFINIRPGVRFSKNSVYDAPPVIPSINTKFRLGKNTDLRLSYARGFRAPILRELYFNFVDANHTILGNPDLKAETSNSFNLSVTQEFFQKSNRSLNATVSGFYNDFKDKIEFAFLSNNVTTLINISNYKTAGLTAESNLTLNHLSFNLNFSYVGRYNSYFNDPAFKNEDLPEYTWSPELSSNIIYQFPKIKMQAGLFYKYTGKLPSYAIGVNQSGQEETYLSKIDSYHLADLTLSKTLFGYFTLQGGVKNLFDVVRISNTSLATGSAHSSSGPILTGYGRSYFLGVNFQWSKKK